VSPILFSLLVGSVGGPFGGIAAAVAGVTFLPKSSDRAKAEILAFAGGFILASAFIEMLGESLRRSEKGPWWAAALVLGGVVAGAAVHAGVQHIWGSDGGGVGSDPDAERRQAREISLSLTVINFIEGLPIGAAFAVSERLGLLIGFLNILENATEGITIASDLAGLRPGFPRLAWLTTAPTVTLGLGAALAAWLGGISPILLVAFLSAGAGIMLHMSTGDILGDARNLNRHRMPTAGFFAGVLCSILFMQLGG
jgi:ZIP family zinc transporter